MLGAANGASVDGNTIVGYGTRNGNTEAFVAVVPEPSGLAPLALGGTALLRRCKRGRKRYAGPFHLPFARIRDRFPS